MPIGSRTTDQSKALRWLGRLKTAIQREGRWRWLAGSVPQIADLCAERYRVWRMRGRPWRRDHRAVFLLIGHRCGGGTQRQIGELETASAPRVSGRSWSAPPGEAGSSGKNAAIARKSYGAGPQAAIERRSRRCSM